MKKTIMALFFAASALCAYAVDHTVTIELKNVNKGAGKIMISISDSEAGYKASKPLKWMALEATAETLTVTETLAEGDYVVSAYQDINGNGKLDTNILGIPKEPVGISNYPGKGIPGGFKDLKTKIDRDLTMTVEMKKI